MRILILSLFIAPMFAFAQSGADCRFSRKGAEHNSISTKGCSDKTCTHVVICGSEAKVVNCKAKNGTCDGYDANECVAGTSSVEAEFNSFPHNGTAACVACMAKCPHQTRDIKPCDRGCPKECAMTQTGMLVEPGPKQGVGGR